MITLCGFLPFFGFTLLAFGFGAFLTDYFNWWRW